MDLQTRSMPAKNSYVNQENINRLSTLV
jgi:hypothetical protein